MCRLNLCVANLPPLESCRFRYYPHIYLTLTSFSILVFMHPINVLCLILCGPGKQSFPEWPCEGSLLGCFWGDSDERCCGPRTVLRTRLSVSVTLSRLHHFHPRLDQRVTATDGFKAGRGRGFSTVLSTLLQFPSPQWNPAPSEYVTNTTYKMWFWFCICLPLYASSV